MSLSGTPVVILGMLRSGTSALATAFSRLGLFLGEEKDFYPPDEFNEGGYWELAEMIGANRRCLTALHMAYHQVGPLPSGWRELPSAEASLDEIESVLTKYFSGHEIWGWKEPRTSILLPFYKEILARNSISPHYVICVRNPLDVAASQHRDGPLADIGERTFGLWIHHTLSSLKETIGQSRSIVMYGDLLANPKRAMEPCVAAVRSWNPSEAEWSDACASVRPDLSHSSRPVSDLDALPALLRQTFEVCEEASKDHEGFQSGKFDLRIEALWNEWLHWNAMVNLPLAPRGELILSWGQGEQTDGIVAPWTPAPQWEAFSAPVDAPAGAIIRAEMHQLPCQIWIRKAVWRCGEREIPAQLKAGLNGHLQSIYGVQRLSSFGKDALLTMVPNEPGPYELSMEMLFQTNQLILIDMVNGIGNELAQARKKLATMPTPPRFQAPR